MAMDGIFSLKGKSILVTGASSGIGKGIALACAEMGASLALNGRNETRLNSVASLIMDSSTFPADLTRFEEIPELVKRMPCFDGIVLCSGISERIPVKQLSPESIEKTVNTNFVAPVNLISELLKQKKINKGSSIVFIASMGADSPSIGNSVYSASKGALISFAKCLMLELAPRQIRVNCISPGMVWTDLIRDDSVAEEQLKEDEKNYPLKRYGTPEDIAGLAVYLLSDSSKWMTGSNIKITGGAK